MPKNLISKFVFTIPNGQIISWKDIYRTNFSMPIISRMHGQFADARHFDWTNLPAVSEADILIMFRHPVERAVSKYYFSVKYPWTQKVPLRKAADQSPINFR